MVGFVNFFIVISDNFVGKVRCFSVKMQIQLHTSPKILTFVHSKNVNYASRFRNYNACGGCHKLDLQMAQTACRIGIYSCRNTRRAVCVRLVVGQCGKRGDLGRGRRDIPAVYPRSRIFVQKTPQNGLHSLHRLPDYRRRDDGQRFYARTDDGVERNELVVSWRYAVYVVNNDSFQGVGRPRTEAAQICRNLFWNTCSRGFVCRGADGAVGVDCCQSTV